MRTSMMNAEKYLEEAEQELERNGPSEGLKVRIGLAIAWALVAAAKAYNGYDEEGE